MFGSDWLGNLFMVVFLFGLLFTAASLLLGFVGGGHIDGHAAGHGGVQVDTNGNAAHAGGHGNGQGEAANEGPGIFNMPTIMATLTWFGGVGYLLRHNLAWDGYISSALAVASGLIGGAIMFVLLARVLWPMMSKPLASADFRLPGTPARVVSSIRSGGVGEILYMKGGTRFTAGAKSADEEAIPKGTEVVIVDYARGLATVQSIGKLLDESQDLEVAGTSTSTTETR